MPRPSRNQILKKVFAHLQKDKKGHLKEAKDDQELSDEVKQKMSHKELRNDLLRKGLITKKDLSKKKR